MKSANNYVKASLLVGGTLLVGTMAANASVEMKLSSLAYSETGFTIGGGYGLTGGDAIGVYQFQFLNAANTPYQTFYSVCLSPLGNLDDKVHTYNFLSFAQANPGQYPATWAWNGNAASPQYWGIENATQLFVKNLPSVNSDTAGAALELAIWTALFDSTGYGTFNLLTGSFSSAIAAGNLNHNAILTGALGADYYADLASIASFTGPGYAGDVLQGDPVVGGITAAGAQDQQFILYPSVPEPSTIFAGALLLLPLGASAVRVVRRNLQA